MSKLASFVVKHRKGIIVVYITLLIPSAIGYLITPHNYDLISYMPDEMNSKQGEQLLEEEFQLSGLGLLMVRDKKNWEINQLVKELEKIEGIDSVSWLKDYADIYVPVSFINEAVTERFTSGDTDLLQVYFSENARAKETNMAVDRINHLISGDEDIVFGGEPAVINEMQSTTEQEMIYYMVLGVIVIIIVLSLSVRSYLAPILFLASVGAAVLINMGSNIIWGEISFMTASIAAAMQLGISVDYSIFLMHRFEEEQVKGKSNDEAMVAALSKSSTAISASALTTAGGFAALIVMQNGIGQDMGLVLAKGIAISLVVTFTLLPSLLLIFSRACNRYRHRIMLPSFKSASRWIVKGRWVFLALFILLLIPSFLAQDRVNYYYSNENYLPEGAVSMDATLDIMEKYGSVDVVYVITPDRGRVQEHRLVNNINMLDSVDSVESISSQVALSLPDFIIPPELLSEFVGGDYRYFLVFLKPLADEGQSFLAVDEIRECAGRFHSEYYVTGNVALNRDMASLVDADSRNVLIVSIIIIGLIIAISFKSYLLPFLLIVAIQLAIWINLGILYFQDQTVSSLTPIIIGAIQLGATVDYAILFTLRYRENIYLFSGRLDAVRQTIEDTGRSILTGALTLFSVTFCIALVASINTTAEMTMLIGRGALISMMVILLWLPSLLLSLEHVIRRTSGSWAPKPFFEKRF